MQDHASHVDVECGRTARTTAAEDGGATVAVVPHDCSAGVPPAVAGASRPRFGSIVIHDRGHLPRWEKEGGVYFVTFRVADSLPKAVLDHIVAEREAVIRTANQMHRDLSADERKKLQQLSTTAIEQYLDTGAGACPLRNTPVAAAVADTLRYFDGKRYRLLAWCIMPNRVHVVFKIFPAYGLADIVHSWKSFSAKRANKILNVAETFWQREYYDHLIRDQAQLFRAIRYVAANPEKANLKNWEWVWVCGQDARTTAAETAALLNGYASSK
jgi:REP element-mobilizing transposase RayT